jgi:hypothetical protein
VCEPCGEDLVLRPEAGQRWDPGEGEGTHRHGDRGNRHLAQETAHPMHVLLIAQPVDHRPGAEEQQCLEEGMGHEVEDTGDVRGGAHGEEHETEL